MNNKINTFDEYKFLSPFKYKRTNNLTIIKNVVGIYFLRINHTFKTKIYSDIRSGY